MLTGKQEKFSVNVFSGMTLTDAYKDAYDAENMTDKQIYEEASKLAKNPKVAQRIQQLRDEANNSKIISAIKRKEILSDIVLNENVSDKMKAIDILNKMDGEYITKIEGNISVDKLEDIL